MAIGLGYSSPPPPLVLLPLAVERIGRPFVLLCILDPNPLRVVGWSSPTQQHPPSLQMMGRTFSRHPNKRRTAVCKLSPPSRKGSTTRPGRGCRNGKKKTRSVQYTLRWRPVGNRWPLVCNRWRLVCNRWRLVCNRWRLVGNRWRLVCNRWRLVCNRWRLVGSHQTSESGCHSKKKRGGGEHPYGTPCVPAKLRRSEEHTTSVLASLFAISRWLPDVRAWNQVKGYCRGLRSTSAPWKALGTALH